MQPQGLTPRQKNWPTSAIVVTLVLALLLGLFGVLGVVGMVTIGRLNNEVEDLSNQLVAAEGRIADLEDDLASAQRKGTVSGLEDLLGGILGGEGATGLEDLLGDLLGG
ncbi:MAG: hypothetical protein ACREA0_20385, partial [bacterium]